MVLELAPVPYPPRRDFAGSCRHSIAAPPALRPCSASRPRLQPPTPRPPRGTLPDLPPMFLVCSGRSSHDRQAQSLARRSRGAIGLRFSAWRLVPAGMRPRSLRLNFVSPCPRTGRGLAGPASRGTSICPRDDARCALVIRSCGRPACCRGRRRRRTLRRWSRSRPRRSTEASAAAWPSAHPGCRRGSGRGSTDPFPSR